MPGPVSNLEKNKTVQVFAGLKKYLSLPHGSVAQLVEQQTLNLRAEGSSPSGFTKNHLEYRGGFFV